MCVANCVCLSLQVTQRTPSFSGCPGPTQTSQLQRSPPVKHTVFLLLSFCLIVLIPLHASFLSRSAVSANLFALTLLPLLIAPLPPQLPPFLSESKTLAKMQLKLFL